MVAKNYTTKTAFLRATKADIRSLEANKLFIDGVNINDLIKNGQVKVLDDRGDFVTDQDLWGTTVTTDENGVVHVSHKFVSNPNGMAPWNRSVYSVKDNKAYTSTDASGEPLCNIQTEMIKSGLCMFDNNPLTLFSSSLSSLTSGNMMFSGTSLTSFSVDLSSLIYGGSMFSSTLLTSFSKNLSNLTDGTYMFMSTPLTSFTSDLSSLINGNSMFSDTLLTSFSKDLSSLTSGTHMFMNTPLTSFTSDLSSLTNGSSMFKNTLLTSFSGDLSSLTNGSSMFSNTHKRGYTTSYYKMVDGVKTQVTEHFRAEGLTSFSGDLGSLHSGYEMFGNGSDVTYTNEEGVTETTKNITPLDEQSVMIIADTIKDLNGFTDWDSSIMSSQRGIIHIGYDSNVCDAAKIEEYCTVIMNKGWIVYLNGTLQTTDEGIEEISTTDEDGIITATPVPYYCKPVEVVQKEAEWTDGEKYYIILGAQKVFGDDLSTYGMFTSIENAAMNMGFTPYEYVEKETEIVEEN